MDKFMTALTIAASLASIISLGFAIPTFFAAHRTQKAIQKHDDARDFMEEIEDYIKALEGIHNSMKTDNVYNRAVIEDIQENIDTIQIRYKSVVSRFGSSVTDLKKCMEEALDEIDKTPNYNKNNVQRALHAVIEHLKKARKRT